VRFTDGQRHLLDNYLRYIIAWNLSSTPCAEDVVDMMDLALAASDCSESRVRHKPRMLDDNQHSYVAGDFEVQISAFVEH
jgi:putative transposase